MVESKDIASSVRKGVALISERSHRSAVNVRCSVYGKSVEMVHRSCFVCVGVSSSSVVVRLRRFGGRVRRVEDLFESLGCYGAR